MSSTSSADTLLRISSNRRRAKALGSGPSLPSRAALRDVRRRLVFPDPGTELSDATTDEETVGDVASAVAGLRLQHVAPLKASERCD
jgi:hypothetical protein